MLSRFIVGSVLGTALIATLTGCSAGGSTAAPASSAASPAPEPATVLAAAVAKTAGVNLKVVLAGDKAEENVTGSYDATHKIGSIAQASGTDRMTIIATPDDLYLAGLSDFKGKTMHLKIAKLDAKSPLAMFADVLTPLTLLTGVKDVSLTAPGSFTGTLDLTKAQGATPGSRKFLDYVLAAAADRAKAVKFTASVNEQGYLAEFDATLPNIADGKDGEYNLKFSDFGSPVTITKPTGSKVVEAPAALYSQQ
ncbi:hypothetical protein GCM10010399_69840 [Dactylosporangium fulvum]|uniref:LppX_LprAFG lipoprotein n=1 Tax=Dactylosporangium fulvum TaxID=53359 RepID=A0ABY5W0K2_9ACTN|nr:hypothetical protein [Dactylosporangium fulvum]UWP83588.1 hypothetical protein Dfulv_04725 [Dactylosporangium fulvum]